MKEKILVCENLEIFYKNNKIIDNLSFSVDEGDFFLILGKNGIGKSTPGSDTHLTLPTNSRV